jgi:hypothetical protein
VSILFADMDGTTIYSQRRLDGASDIAPVEFFDGNPIAWMTTAAVSALAALTKRLEFVPTTTRMQHQFERIRIPGVRHNYAIIANGARILINGVEDTAWAATVAARTASAAPLEDALAILKERVGDEPWVLRVLGIEGVLTVVSGRSGVSPPDWFYDLAAGLAADWGYTVYPQGPKTFLIPDAITKEAAAAEIHCRLGRERVTFATGDHHIDAGIMRYADHAIQPAHGVNVPGIIVTERSGVYAGEDILRFINDRMATAARPGA